MLFPEDDTHYLYTGRSKELTLEKKNAIDECMGYKQKAQVPLPHSQTIHELLAGMGMKL